MTRARYLIAAAGCLWLLVMGVGLAQQAQSAAVEAEQQVFDRDAEIVHLRTEIATCHATIDSLELGRQVTDLVRRCEATYVVKCRWDDAQRRVVKDPPAPSALSPATPDPPPAATSQGGTQER